MNRTAQRLSHKLYEAIYEPKIGDRVTVFSFTTFVEDRVTGTVVARHRRGESVSVLIDGHDSSRRVDPRQLAPVSTCETCSTACRCEGGIDGIGCEHWACWGRATTFDTDAACPGVAAERARMAAARYVRAFEVA